MLKTSVQSNSIHQGNAQYAGCTLTKGFRTGPNWPACVTGRLSKGSRLNISCCQQGFSLTEATHDSFNFRMLAF
jgi:hypothetical protein